MDPLRLDRGEGDRDQLVATLGRLIGLPIEFIDVDLLLLSIPRPLGPKEGLRFPRLRPRELGELLLSPLIFCLCCPLLPLGAILSGDFLLPKLSTLPGDEGLTLSGFNSTELLSGEGVRSLNTMAFSELFRCPMEVLCAPALLSFEQLGLLFPLMELLDLRKGGGEGERLQRLLPRLKLLRLPIELAEDVALLSPSPVSPVLLFLLFRLLRNRLNGDMLRLGESDKALLLL
jgi:hypothetical protein